MTFFEKIVAFFASIPSEVYVFLISILPIVELRGAIPVGAGLGLPFYINYPLSVIGNLLPVPFILLFIPRILDFLARFKHFRPMVEWLRNKADKHSGKVLGGGKNKELPKEQNQDGDASATVSPSEDGALAYENRSSGVGVSVFTVDGEEAGFRESIDDEQPSDSCTGEAKRKMSGGIFAALLLFVAVPLPGTGAWTGALVSALFNLPRGKSMLAISLGVMASGVVMCLASYGVLGFLSFLL